MTNRQGLRPGGASVASRPPTYSEEKQMRTIKLVIIGAGGKEFTRGLIHDLVLDRELTSSAAIEVSLVDVDADRLGAMLAHANRCVEYSGSQNIRFTAETERRKALPGADFVVVSIAIERMALWEQDFRIALSFGFKHVFGENGGPAALFHALRNYRIILPICRDVEELCPDAWLMNFTNPEARILTAILRLTKVKAFGLCHGFHSLQHTAARILDRPAEELDVRSAGMNHLYTYVRIADRRSGESLIPQFEQKATEDIASFDPFTRHLFEKYGVLGYASADHTGEYVGYAHEFMPQRWMFGIENHKVYKEIKADPLLAYMAWGNGHWNRIDEYLASGKAGIFDDYFSGRRKLDDTFVKQSGELAVPIIGDIVLNRKAWRPSVNILNTGGYIANLALDGCVEVPAVVDQRGLRPESVGELPEAFAALIRRQHSIQKLLVQAYAEKSRKLLLQALLIDPVVDSAKRAEEYLDYTLKLQADYLPEFS